MPEPLLALTSTLSSWRGNLRDSGLLLKIANLYDPIGKLGKPDQQERGFTAIFNEHKEDQTLQEYLAELIAALEQILAEGGDILTKQAADELQRILDEIRKRQKQSLPDLDPWIECALVSLAGVVDYTFGMPLATIVAAGIIAAKKSKTRIIDLYDCAQKEYWESLHLKGGPKFSSPLKAKLVNASVEEIQAALQTPKGLYQLPDPNHQQTLLKEGKKTR